MSGCGEEIRHACHAVRPRLGCFGSSSARDPSVTISTTSRRNSFTVGCQARRTSTIVLSDVGRVYSGPGKTLGSRLGLHIHQSSSIRVLVTCRKRTKISVRISSSFSAPSAPRMAESYRQARCFAKSAWHSRYGCTVRASEAVQPGSRAPSKSAPVWPLLILTLVSFVGRGMMERIRTSISTELGILV